MAKIELKEIPIDKILANFTQPREHFDKEKIKELAESILSNGLINPISVREYKGGRYMIVAGERRWRACKVAGLKTIQAFVKEYKDGEGQMMIDSLIENVHREDLEPIERARFLKRIADIEKIYHTKDDFSARGYRKGDINIKELAKKVGMNSATVGDDLTLLKAGFEPTDIKEVARTKLVRIASIEDKKIRERILEKAQDRSLDDISKMIAITKKADKEVKEALLSDKIDVKQAESLMKIGSEKARERALEQVKQHRHIADITPKLMERAKPELTDVVKRQFDTIQRKIFEYLNEGKVSLSKANQNLKEANLMLSQLMNKSFEYGLQKRTLIVTMQQMKSISDKINEFEIQRDRFDDLKDTFIERIEKRLEELK